MTDISKHDLNLWQKLAAISKEIGHVEKTGKNSHFNYAFIEHSQIVAAGREIMEEYGVTIDLEALDATWDEAKNTRVLLHMNYTVTNADKPSETFTRRWVSEAMDQQDKGINKALTAAEKNVFMKLFHISDVDLEADENDQPQAKKSTPAPRQNTATAATSRPVTPQAVQPANRPAPAQAAPRPAATPSPIQAPTPINKNQSAGHTCPICDGPVVTFEGVGTKENPTEAYKGEKCTAKGCTYKKRIA